MFYGCSFVSYGITHFCTRSEFLTTKHPYSMMISMFVFAFLSFFTFLRESLSLLDDNLLIRFDIINNTPLTSQNSQTPNFETVSFSYGEHLTHIMHFICSCFESASFGILISIYNKPMTLNRDIIIMFIARFVQMTCISHSFSKIPLSKPVYYIFGFLNSIISPVLVILRIRMEITKAKSLYAIISAVMMGFFLYIGASSIHNSRISIRHKPYGSALLALFGFMIPLLLRFWGVDYLE